MPDFPDMKELFKMAESLRGANLQSKSVDSIQAELSEFLRGYRPLAIGRSSHQMWFRARPCDGPEGYRSLGEMIYPPTGSRDYGRAQFPGSQVLYASWNRSTTLDEIGVQPGDYVQLIALRPIENIQIRCHVIGEYQRFHSSGRSFLYSEILGEAIENQSRNEDNELHKYIYVDSVISELFRRQVKRSFEYKITASYAERILGASQSGIVYPSVENFGAMNLAISAKVFDSQFEVVWTDVVQVKNSYGYSLYDLEKIRSSCDFSESGDINWDSTVERTFLWSPREGYREEMHLPGWRNSKR